MLSIYIREVKQLYTDIFDYKLQDFVKIINNFSQNYFH